MTGSTKVTIRISNKEADVISELLMILEDCVFDLNDHDYANVIKAIARHCKDTGVDDYGDTIVIEYEEE